MYLHLTVHILYRSSATRFLNELGPFFNRIKALPPPLYTIGSSQNTIEKIRIAVLDSGVDGSGTSAIIRSAIKHGRINLNRSKSFVVDSRPIDWQVDSHGHGTHVARLLLQTAPAAEICVAKICIGKVINNEFMPGIAQVSFSPLIHCPFIILE